MNIRIMSTVTAMLACGAPLVCLEAQAPSPLSIDAALGQSEFQPYAPLLLSPDDRLVAYTLRNPKLVGQIPVNSWFTSTGTPSTATGARIRITEVQTGRTLAVGDETAATWGPSWSPNGRYLAFYSDVGGLARLWVRETTTGRVRRVSDAIVRGHRAIAIPRWTPDSRNVVVPILPYGSVLTEAVRPAVDAARQAVRERDSATVTVMRADPAERYGGQFKGGRSMNNRTSLEADLALVNIATGAVTTLAHGYWPFEYAVAPSGRFVMFTSMRPETLRPRWTVPYDVLVVKLGGAGPSAPRVIIPSAPLTYSSRSVLWSPDGATLVYSVTDTAGRDQFFAADTTDWRPRRIATSGVPLGLDSTAYTEQTVWWDKDGRTLYALAMHSVAAVSMPDGVVRSVSRAPRGFETLSIVGRQAGATAHTDSGRSLLIAIRNDSTKRMGFARVDLTSGDWTLLVDEDRHFGQRYHFPIDVAKNGRMVFLREDAQHPTDVWIADADFSTPRQLTHVAPEMEKVAFGESRLIHFTTASGSQRRATLLLPTGYRSGVRYPLVVYPYPLSLRSNDLNIFGVTGTGVENMQLLATRGFAVLAPDVPPFDWKDQMRDLASIIQCGVDRAIALGVADSTRLGIMGHSWGGYTALAVIAQTERFRAAVMRGGVGDHVTATAILQAGGFAYGLQLEEQFFGGTVWERPELYHRNSPIFLLDRVRTPLLILHGEGETTVPIFMADQVFSGLQRLGREVEFARYANENHAESRWTHANQRDFLTRMIGWFESHLKGGPEGRSTAAPGIQ
jgi:dipeptidyl aminopeptidase/acylaminoacyl peptidase